MAAHETAFVAIRGELRYQESLGHTWKNRNHPTVGEELLLIEEYMALARTAYTRNPGDAEALDVLRKVAAMCVRAMSNGGVVMRAGFE